MSMVLGVGLGIGLALSFNGFFEVFGFIFRIFGGSSTTITRTLVYPWGSLALVSASVFGAVVLALLVTTRRTLAADLASVLKGSDDERDRHQASRHHPRSGRGLPRLRIEGRRRQRRRPSWPEHRHAQRRSRRCGRPLWFWKIDPHEVPWRLDEAQRGLRQPRRTQHDPPDRPRTGQLRSKRSPSSSRKETCSTTSTPATTSRSRSSTKACAPASPSARRSTCLSGCRWPPRHGLAHDALRR